MQRHPVYFGLALIFFVLCLLLPGPGRLQAASFTADMVETHDGKTKTNKFYLLDHLYRMDVQDEGRDITVLVNRQRGKTRLIVPWEKVYLEIDNDDMQSLMNNPFASLAYMAEKYDVKQAGTETVDGLSCKKQVISAQGKEVMIAWISSKYDLAVKIDNTLGKRQMALKNIRERKVDPSLFTVPAGYKLVESIPLAAPDWAGKIAAAPVMRPPFEKSLQQGQIIRIKPVRDFAIELNVKSLSGQKGSFSSTAFKDGRPLKLITGYAGGGRKTHKETPGQADEIVVRSQSGQVVVTAQMVEAPEGMILKAYELGPNAGRQYDFDHRKAARVIVTDDPSDGKPSRGSFGIYKTVEEKHPGGIVAYQNKKIESGDLQLANGASRTWSFEPSQQIGLVDIDLQEGGVKVRVEQPQKRGTTPPAWAKGGAAAPVAAVAAEAPTTASAGTSSLSPRAAHAASRNNTAETPRMVLVLDASGSMWGQIDGKAKIEIAKEVMAELIDAIPANFQTGLTVYGHRRKGDCKDIEMVIPVGSHNAAAMKAKMMAISPKGKTPLSEAVRQAAKALRYTEERATVILVSDGLETCDVDPCALAAELAMSGVDFTVHVIGFDISKGDQARLRCLADRTGGLFLAADSAGALRDALFKTVEEVKAPPPPVKEAPGQATLKGPASVAAGSAFTVEWQGPDSRGDYIAIAEKGSKDGHHKDYAYTKRGNPAQFTAPGQVGDYELRYVHAYSHTVIGRAPIAVVPVQASVQAPAQVDVAVAFDVQWQGPAYQSDYICISRPDQRAGSYVNYTYTRAGNPLQLRAPSDPGTYEVRYILGRDSQLLAKQTIEVKGVGASVDAPPVADVATEFEVSWTGPGNKEDYVCISRPDQKAGQYVNYTYTNRGNPLKVRAPSEAGTYEVRYILGRGSKLLASSTMEIKEVTASVLAPASADVATEFEVSWQGPGNKEDYVCISRLDQKAGQYVNYTYTNTGNPLKVRAPSEAGTYEVRYILGRGSKLLAKTTMEIKAVGASIQQVPASADVAAEFEVRWQGPGNKEDYVCISRPDQKAGQYVNYTYTNRGNPLKVRAPSEPGTYEVRYILGRGSKLLAKATIEIKGVTASIQAPASADVAAEFDVSWQGPGNKEDYICVSRTDQKAGSYVNYTYTNRGNPLTVRAPSEPGTYEVRYILGRGSKLLAKSAIEVKAVSAKLSPPGSGAVDAKIAVSWEGPGYKEDFICISRPDQRPGSYVTYTYTNRGNPLDVRTPKEPGTYEVRYILGRGNKMLAKATITIK